MAKLLNIRCKEGTKEIKATVFRKKIGGEVFFYYDHYKVFEDLFFDGEDEEEQKIIILCELKSGLKISEGSTIEEAVQTAQDRVNKYGKERFQEIIAKNQSEHGIINL